MSDSNPHRGPRIEPREWPEHTPGKMPHTLRCPNCGVQGPSDVTDSRGRADGSLIRRRRQCLACKGRFSTLEKIETVEEKIQKKKDRLLMAKAQIERKLEEVDLLRSSSLTEQA